MRASGIRKTDIPIFLYLFLDFLMYFDISGFVFAKKITCAINRQTVVVTSLKMASLDHSEPTRPPQVDISNLLHHRRHVIKLSQDKKILKSALSL